MKYKTKYPNLSLQKHTEQLQSLVGPMLVVVSGGVVVPARIDDIKACVCVYGLCT